MDTFDQKAATFTRRLQNARMSLLINQPFYALLLLHMKFALDETCETVYTDGERIAFCPDFLEEISDSELEFLLMHGALHAALGHPFRKQSEYDLKCYDRACDIVVNSNILKSFEMDERRITLKSRGIAHHKAPDGKEGFLYTVDEVYQALCNTPEFKKSKPLKASKSETTKKQRKEDDAKDSDQRGKSDDSDSFSQKAKKKSKKKGKDATEEDYSDEAMNALISSMLKGRTTHGTIDPDANVNLEDPEKEGEMDDHSFWCGDDEIHSDRNKWDAISLKSTQQVLELSKSNKGFGGPPFCLVRKLKDLTEPEVDWRKLLNEFVQEEVNDYSFSPPDRRMDDSPFFLPDFNEKSDSVKNVWFLIDTSGSIGDLAMTAAYSEIANAIDLFDGHLEGMLSFTEVFVTDPIPFCSKEELLEIKPKGGGGNDFGEIFRYMQKNMLGNLPASIVILTDGYDAYPEEEESLGVPVLWLLNNEHVPPPPWGRWARFRAEKRKT